MKSADTILVEHLANVEVMKTIAENMAKILDATYCKVDLQKDIVDQCTTLGTEDKEKLLHVL
eukprot:14491347-Ditylum_brightwellii.AAC.1